MSPIEKPKDIFGAGYEDEVEAEARLRNYFGL